MKHIRPNSLVLIINNDHLLVQRGFDKIKNRTFVRLLGGGIEFGETSIACIKRELKEEFNLTLNKVILIKSIENIFFYDGEPKHEITFLYSANIKDRKMYERERLYRLDKGDLYAEWVSIKEIKEGHLVMFPSEAIDFL